MPLSLRSAADTVAKLPRGLSVAAAAIAAATTSLLLISVAISRSHQVASSSPPPGPSTSASAAAALPPAPGPSPLPDAEHHHLPLLPVPPCPPNVTHLVPCHDPPSGERHCPPRPPLPLPHLQKEPPPHPPHPPPTPPHCRVQPPPGYRPPPPWPARRKRVRYANVEVPLLPKAKVAAGLGEWMVFPNGVGNYIEQLERLVPLRGVVVRTALDIGCGVASFGDYLLNYDGLYMLEIDRLLRPGGYWIYSGPLISWKSPAMNDVLYKLHWTKLAEWDTTAVWRKPTNHLHCDHEEKLYGLPPLCTGDDPDSAWYTNTSTCITCIPRVPVNGCASGAVGNWPKRLGAAPPRIASGEMKWLSIQAYKNDSLIWDKRVSFYITYLNNSFNETYRNVMDMNAGFGGFAAAMSNYPVWVMNVVPANVTNNTLGIIYERGLVGTYMDWCEAFSTYPRTYDLIHANGVFSLYMHRCGIIDILVEMDRILRPGGAVVVRDRADVVLKLKKDADRLGWLSRIVDTENGALDPEKLLIVDKPFPPPGS